MTERDQVFWGLTVVAALCAIAAAVALAWAHFSWPTVIGAGFGAAASAFTSLATAWHNLAPKP